MRPILLTAGAASLGMIPIAPQVFWGPMAFAMIGGIFAATFLTLLFLPALYVGWYGIHEVQPVKRTAPIAIGGRYKDEPRAWTTRTCTRAVIYCACSTCIQEANVMVGQAVRSCALPQQREVSKRWGAVVVMACERSELRPVAPCRQCLRHRANAADILPRERLRWPPDERGRGE